MQTEIYYFTGTGNTLKIARDIAQELDTEAIIPIAKSIKSKKAASSADIIGIVCPVYCLDVPEIVKEFIKKMDLKEGAYVFGIVNCGAQAGNSLYSVEKVLKENNINLDAGFVFYMPDNSIAFPTELEKYSSMFVNEQKKVKEISRIIKSRKSMGIEKSESIRGKILASKFVSNISKMVFYDVMGVRNKTNDKDKCNNCGLCEKVCPTENIKFNNSEYIWGKNCEQCFACIHWCPNKAVKFDRYKTKGNYQYTHPEIFVKDIIAQK